MNTIKDNPYRTLGLLVGASTREISRQTSRLRKIIAAEQEPPTDDFSFPAFGNLTRTEKNIEEASSKLNLDSDKLNAALFWFWNGNPITDEVAFEALKNGNIEGAYQIWDKLIVETKEDNKRFWRIVTEKNSSAFHNSFVLEMLRADGNKHNAVVANLYFLESEFSQKFISTIADSTHKTNTKEIQLDFLNNVLLETGERNANLSLSKFITIINSINFIAKADFLNTISRKFANNISALIDTARKKRTANKATAAKTGEELSKQSKNDLEQLKSAVGVENFVYSNTADKVANEILQCSIDFFNYSQEANASNDYHNTAIKLAKQAESIAVGNLTKDRIKENLNTLEEMQFKAIQVLSIVKQAYEQLAIENVRLMQFGQYKTLNESAIVDLIKKGISKNDVDFIKSSNNYTKINEYKNLVNYVMGKLGYSYKSSIKYLDYWNITRIPKITSRPTYKPTTTSKKSSDNWILWLLGILTILGVIIGAANDGHWIIGGGSGFVVGLIIVGMFSD